MDATRAQSVAIRAATMAGLRLEGARLLRSGSHVMFLLPEAIVAHVGPAGSQERARRELAVARWLARHDFPAVRPINVPGTAGLTVIDEHPVTWWQAIPPAPSGKHHRARPRSTRVSQPARPQTRPRATQVLSL